MMRLICSAVLLSPLLAHAGSPNPSDSGAPALGRLFFTPEQRAVLDETRLHGRKSATEAPVAERSITFQGFVRPHNGSPTLWLNGQAVTSRQLPPNVALVKGASGNTFLTVQQGKSRHRAQPKVGQRVDLGSGRISEATALPSAKPEELDLPVTGKNRSEANADSELPATSP